MKTLLIHGTDILGIDPVEDSAKFTIGSGANTVIYQKDVVAGLELCVVNSLPVGFSTATHMWADGAIQLRPPVALSGNKLDDLKAKLFSEIENTVLAICTKPNILRVEYERREAEAIAYRDNGVVGVAGDYLYDFAVSENRTYADAATRVLSQAAAFRNAEKPLASCRMRKYEVLRASTEADVRAVHAETMTAIGAVVATLG